MKNSRREKEMARDFNGTNESITNDNGISTIDVSVFTIFNWVNPDTVLANQQLNGTASAISSGNSAATISIRTSSVWQFDYRFSTTTGTWTFGTPTNGSWFAIGVDYDRGLTTNNPNSFENGTLVAESETATPNGTAKSGVDSFTCGENVGLGTDLNGQLAYCCFWDVVLSSNEESALANGVNPFAIRNSNLQYNYPFDGNNSPENEYVQQANGTLKGTTKFSGNPPVELIENYL